MYINYSLHESINFAVEQETKKSCKTAMSEERNAAIKKGVKQMTKAASTSPAHMTWVGKNGERGITRQPVKLQSSV